MPQVGTSSVRRFVNNEFEESDSNSSKSEADEAESDQLLNQQDQDSILDSVSNDSNEDGDDENWSNQVESEWSDFDPIFHTDEGDLTQELQE